MDRGYVDYDLFDPWTEEGIWFVTKAKSNMKYRVIESRTIPERGHILSDELIEFTGYDTNRICPHTLRRVVVWDVAKEREIVLLTNHLKFAASTISLIYKDRQQIELFLRQLNRI